jgi:hypothetical protein
MPHRTITAEITESSSGVIFPFLSDLKDIKALLKSQGDKLFDVQQYDKAIEKYLKVPGVKDNELLLKRIAECHLMRGALPKAIHFYELAHEKSDKQNEANRFSIAKCLLEQGKLEDLGMLLADIARNANRTSDRIKAKIGFLAIFKGRSTHALQSLQYLTSLTGEDSDHVPRPSPDTHFFSHTTSLKQDQNRAHLSNSLMKSYNEPFEQIKYYSEERDALHSKLFGPPTTLLFNHVLTPARPIEFRSDWAKTIQPYHILDHHPLSDCYPMATGERLERIRRKFNPNNTGNFAVASVVIFQDKILDGRTIYHLAMEAGAWLKYKVLQGSELAAKEYLYRQSVQKILSRSQRLVLLVEAYANEFKGLKGSNQSFSKQLQSILIKLSQEYDVPSQQLRIGLKEKLSEARLAKRTQQNLEASIELLAEHDNFSVEDFRIRANCMGLAERYQRLKS